jgi:hypothetical protein
MGPASFGTVSYQDYEAPSVKKALERRRDYVVRSGNGRRSAASVI